MGRKLLSLAVMLLLAAPVFAQGPVAVAPREGVLLLRNGGVLRGKITRDGDRYYVALPDGEVRVRANDVSALCGDLDECYRHKLSQLRRGDIRDHLDLADWCVEQGLLGPAARQLSAALAINPRHPRIALIERRIRLAQREAPAAAAPATAPAEARQDHDELERLVRSLPRGAVEHFTSTVHPILQNHCATSGCHSSAVDSAEVGFSLLRLPRGRTATQRLTQRNLYAALQVVNRNEPGESPLLTVPLEAHGTAEGPIFTSRNVAAYLELVAFARSVATPRRGGSRPAVESPAPSTVEPTDSAAASRIGEAAPERQPRNGPAATEGESQPPVRTAQRDAFDPDIFNRRYHPDGPRR